MDIRVNEQPLEPPSLPDLSIGQLLESIRQTEDGQGRVMVNIELDGRAITLQDPDTDFARPAADFQRLVISSDVPGTLAARVLRETGAHLPLLNQKLTGAVTAIRSGKAPEAAELLSDALPFVGTVQEVVMRTCLLTGTTPADLDFEGEAVAAHLEQVTGQLNELREALESRDMVRVADVLEYELVPRIEKWEALLGTLADQHDPAR